MSFSFCLQINSTLHLKTVSFINSIKIDFLIKFIYFQMPSLRSEQLKELVNGVSLVYITIFLCHFHFASCITPAITKTRNIIYAWNETRPFADIQHNNLLIYCQQASSLFVPESENTLIYFNKSQYGDYSEINRITLAPPSLLTSPPTYLSRLMISSDSTKFLTSYQNKYNSTELTFLSTYINNVFVFNVTDLSRCKKFFNFSSNGLTILCEQIAPNGIPRLIVFADRSGGTNYQIIPWIDNNYSNSHYLSTMHLLSSDGSEITSFIFIYESQNNNVHFSIRNYIVNYDNLSIDSSSSGFSLLFSYSLYSNPKIISQNQNCFVFAHRNSSFLIFSNINGPWKLTQHLNSRQMANYNLDPNILSAVSQNGRYFLVKTATNAYLYEFNTTTSRYDYVKLIEIPSLAPFQIAISNNGDVFVLDQQLFIIQNRFSGFSDYADNQSSVNLQQIRGLLIFLFIFFFCFSLLMIVCLCKIKKQLAREKQPNREEAVGYIHSQNDINSKSNNQSKNQIIELQKGEKIVRQEPMLFNIQE